MKISMVVPFVDQPDITRRCIEVLVANTTQPVELVMIDNGSDESYLKTAKQLVKGSNLELVYVRNDENIGVLPVFKQGFEVATGDVICVIHNDVLIHEFGWSEKVDQAFSSHPRLGLAGIFGAVGVGDNGGRVRSQSKMLGKEWGSCQCHDVAWKHHSEYLEGIAPAAILDAVGMFFSREAADALINSDMFADWRALNHFQDRIMPLKLIDKGFQVATLGIGFDHFSGATANFSEKWRDLARKWCEKQGLPITDAPDHDMYLVAEAQFFEEFGRRLPCTVDSTWQYHFQGIA